MIRVKRKRVAVLVAIAVLVAGVATWSVTRSSGTKQHAVADAAGSSLVTITERTLTSQQQVNGTLGFAGATSVIEPVGTAPAAVAQADQQLGSAMQALAAAEITLRDAQGALATDRQSLANDQARLSADQQKQANDCAGAGAAGSACDADRQAVAADQKQVDADNEKVATDEKSVAQAQTGLTNARLSLAGAQTAASDAHNSAVAYAATSTYTMLPAVGQVVSRGEPLFAISGQRVPLLYGDVVPWRAFRSGMTSGPDVAELNQNLADLGYAPGLAGSDRFSSSTTAAIRRLQKALGLEPTGELLLGAVVFRPGAVRVTAVTPKLSGAVQPGEPVLDVTSTTRQVVVQLDAAQQSQVKAGDPVTITLPDNHTTPGTVTAVSTVAKSSSSDSGGDSNSSPPTVEVDITPKDSAATGTLDAAPVQVSITTDSVDHALVVPVTALLAMPGGGYAVDIVSPAGLRHLATVTLGLFDDAEGLVQITGPDIHAGQQVANAAS